MPAFRADHKTESQVPRMLFRSLKGLIIVSVLVLRSENNLRSSPIYVRTTQQANGKSVCPADYGQALGFSRYFAQ